MHSSSSSSSSTKWGSSDIRKCGKKVGAHNEVCLDDIPLQPYETQEMIRKTSNGWRAFGVGAVLAESGGLEHHVIISRSDGRVLGVYDVEDDRPETCRGDLRLLGKEVLFEVIPKNASEVQVFVIVDAPKKS